MRRFLIIAGIMLPVFFLSACENALDLNNERPVLEFKSEVEVTSEKMNLSANFFRSKTGETQIEITSPKTLAGLKISHSNSENSITKSDLTYKTDGLILPDFSDVAAVLEALECIANNPDESPFYKNTEEIAFIGKISTGKFELRASRKTGMITEIKIGEKTTAKFSNQEKL